MEIVFLNNNREEWDTFASKSDDAWFWHTTESMEYVQELSKESCIANYSFSIVENSETLAVCPVIVERNALAKDIKQFSFAGMPIPFPAMRNDLPLRKRERALDFYIQTLAGLAKKEDVGYVSVRIPAVAKSYLLHGTPFANPLIKYGFVDLAYLTQVVELRRGLMDLWSDIRKGHKSDVKRAGEMCEVKVWDHGTITAEKIREYQVLHEKDAGRVTRPQRTFDLMLWWIRNRHAILVEAEQRGHAIGFSLIILFGSGAYYGSSCKDPDFQEIGVSHLIQWTTIRWLKENCFEFYDIGIQHYFPQWYDPATPKDISISLFVRGFGGITVPLVTAEFFYSKELLRQTLEMRWLRYLSALSSDQNEK